MTKRFIIIKIGALGDAVMALPLMLALKKKHPGSHLTWVGGVSLAPLLTAFPDIDTFIPVDESALFSGKKWKQMLVVLLTWRHLLKYRYETSFLLHNDARYTLLTLPLRAKQKQKATYDSALKLDRYQAVSNLSLLDAITPTLEIEYPKLSFAEILGETHPLNALFTGEKTVALFPGGAKNIAREQLLKRWPLTHYVSLAKMLLAEGYTVVLLGAESDAWTIPAFNGLPAMILIGKTSLLELIYAIHKASLFITHDTGPMHLAKLTDTPTIALFGPTSEKTFHSFATKENTLHPLRSSAPLPCSPCYDGKDFLPCKNPLCMSTLTPEAVFEYAHASFSRSCSP